MTFVNDQTISIKLNSHFKEDTQFKDGLSLKNTIKNTYSSVHHSHTVLMKVCPCGRYRQLNSVLYPYNHILKSSKIIFNGLVLKDF